MSIFKFLKNRKSNFSKKPHHPTTTIDFNTYSCLIKELETLSSYGRNKSIREVAEDTLYYVKSKSMKTTITFYKGYDEENLLLYNILYKYDFFDNLEKNGINKLFTFCSYPVNKSALYYKK